VGQWQWDRRERLETRVDRKPRDAVIPSLAGWFRPPRLAVHFSQLAINASLASLAIGYAERGGQRTSLGTHRYGERADRDGCCLKWDATGTRDAATHHGRCIMTEDETEAEVQLLEFVRGNDGEEFKLTRPVHGTLLATNTCAGALEDLVHGGAKDHNRAETKRREVLNPRTAK
jgi:hypothetical protein